ncbi:uncharacterized protein TA08410 [Theileria annulata]|uniref:PH domain-containing protein n=1 Tax=Theileria annulata TaxID=5874 RepID=Q4U9N2_THEAN|nr:uncharacterized protein TA08410 [Theileria annulata]CAI76471.1 hypothetical protein TA08410 [Theileria annulata]|eukprot:XP_953096.1 hypothetical protein TA08410 [Theileria annulata]
MEPPNEPTQASPKPEFPWLPKECIFTMQQWLYRRTLHTKRYKKRYVVLHNERLYSFTKLPPFDKFDLNNINTVLRSASNSWILTGSVVSADTDVNTGLFKWKIEFKNYKKPITAIENINKFLTDKPDLTIGNVDHIDCIFEDVTSSVLENKTVNIEAQDCLWFATTNHKIASDWLIALLYTSRYGSLYNLIYKNPSRRRFQQFTLPWFLMALDYLPNLSKDENSKPPLSSFTYIKIEIKRVFDFPMLPNAKIYCAVEFNSSFYIIQLYRFERENLTSTPSAMVREEEPTSSLAAYISRNSEYSICRLPSDDLSVAQLNDPKNSLPDDECSQSSYYNANAQFTTLEGGINKFNATVQSLAPSNTSVPNSVAGLPDDDPQNVITRLLNLNSHKDIKKKQVVEKRSIIYDGASVYIPVYKNTTQEIVWLHFFGDYDVYMGTASIRDVDFASRDPAPVKTCMIKLIEGLNPLHYKRVDVSNYKGESTVLKSSARSISNDRGFVELSVIIPKHLGNFLDPVIISHGSPKEYLSNASRSSISMGIQMLIANIKRVRQSFTVLKDIIHALKSILEFRSMFTSFTAMFYFILVFGIFPNRMLVIFLLPILSYIVCTHPSFIDLTFLFLLKFPILIAILPKRFTYPFLLMPKLSCILCSKKPSFLKQNTQIVDPDMVSKEEISSKTFQYSSNKKLPKSMYLNHSSSETEVIVNPFSAANATQVNTDPNRKRELPQESYDESNVLNQPTYVDFEKRISVHINSLPMITSKHLLNDSIEITRYKGTRIETCKHRGIIMSYLSVMFINEIGVELFDSVHGDGLAIIKGYHDIYYNIPPYRNVPFWPNVKFTLYFLFYMLFLTFFGGISNLQILHLLHRNKLICRLILESKGVVESKPKGQHHQTKQRNVSLYENERRILFGKFSKLNLRFYERGYFSTEDGQFVSVDLSKYLVRLVVNDNTDQEGWTYAKNWNSPFTNSPNSMTFVRRRKWILTPNDSKNIEYILKSRFPSKLSSDYFVNMKQNDQKNEPENDCVSLTSEDSSGSSKLTTSNAKNNVNEEESENKNDSVDGAEEQQLQDGENTKTSVKPSDTNHDISSIDDENIARLYFRKGKVKRLVDRIKDARERRKSQKQDNSNMQEYINSLVANVAPDKISEVGSQKQPKRSRILRSLKKSKYSENVNSLTERGTNHINSLLQENDPEIKSLYSGLRFREKSESSLPTGSDGQNEHDGNDLLKSLMNLNQNESSQTILESDILLPSTLTLNLNEDTTPQLTLNDNLHFDPNYMKKRPPKVTTIRKLYKMAKPLEKDLKLQEHSNRSQSTSKIARLVNYLTYLHNPDETPSSDRTAYSTISQFSTNSQGNFKIKTNIYLNNWIII